MISVNSFLKNLDKRSFYPFLCIKRNWRRKNVTEYQYICDIAMELNNVAVDLYEKNEHYIALKLFKSACKAIMTIFLPSDNHTSSMSESKNDFISQIVEGKQRLHQIYFSSQKNQKKGLHTYQWSDSENNITPQCFCEAIKITKSTTQSSNAHDNCTNTSIVMYNIGLCYMKRAEYEIAEQVFQSSLALQPKSSRESSVHASNSIINAASFNNIGYIKYKHGNLNEAKIMFDKALYNTINTIRQENHSESNQEQYQAFIAHATSDENEMICNKKCIATILYNSGIINAYLGIDDKVLQLFQRSLSMHEAVLGDNHPDIAIIQHNMGIIYLEIGKVNDATHAFFESLKIVRFVFGNDHCNVAKELFHLGYICEMRGENDDALHLYEEVLRVEKKNIGLIDQEAIITTMCHIGMIHHSRGDLKKALNVFIESLNAAKEAEGNIRRQSIIYILCQMIKIHVDDGNVSKAISLYREAADAIDLAKRDDITIETEEFLQLQDLFLNPPAAAAA